MKACSELFEQFLCETEHHPIGNGMRIDFRKGESVGRLTGLITENGTLGMLDAADYNNIYMVSPSWKYCKLIMWTDM